MKETASVNSGDLIQIRSGLLGGGDVGMIVGPSMDPAGPGYFDVLFSDGIHTIHKTSMRKMRRLRSFSNKETTGETR